eukprot:1997804-Pleurochrysis_carterae.AAC.2
MARRKKSFPSAFGFDDRQQASAEAAEGGQLNGNALSKANAKESCKAKEWNHRSRRRRRGARRTQRLKFKRAGYRRRARSLWRRQRGLTALTLTNVSQEQLMRC